MSRRLLHRGRAAAGKAARAILADLLAQAKQPSSMYSPRTHLSTPDALLDAIDDVVDEGTTVQMSLSQGLRRAATRIETALRCATGSATPSDDCSVPIFSQAHAKLRVIRPMRLAKHTEGGPEDKSSSDSG